MKLRNVRRDDVLGSGLHLKHLFHCILLSPCVNSFTAEASRLSLSSHCHLNIMWFLRPTYTKPNSLSFLSIQSASCVPYGISGTTILPFIPGLTVQIKEISPNPPSQKSSISHLYMNSILFLCQGAHSSPLIDGVVHCVSPSIRVHTPWGQGFGWVFLHS